MTNASYINNKNPKSYWPPPHQKGCGGQWCCPGISKNLILNCRSQMPGGDGKAKGPWAAAPLQSAQLHLWNKEKNPLAEHKLLSTFSSPHQNLGSQEHTEQNRSVQLLCPMTKEIYNWDKKSHNYIFIDFNILINSNNSHLTKWFSDLFVCVDVKMLEGKLFYNTGDFDDLPLYFKVLFSSNSSTSAVARALSPSCCHDNNALPNSEYWNPSAV